MKKVTRQTQANRAAAAWKRQYPNDRLEIRRQLESLGPTPDPDAVDAAIGNTSWTDTPRCDECGTYQHDVVILLGEEPDYDSSTVHLCRSCLVAALALLG